MIIIKLFVKHLISNSIHENSEIMRDPCSGTFLHLLIIKATLTQRFTFQFTGPVLYVCTGCEGHKSTVHGVYSWRYFLHRGSEVGCWSLDLANFHFYQGEHLSAEGLQLMKAGRV